MHDGSKVLLGSTQSSYREGVTSYAVDDTSLFPAGTFVRIDSTGALSTEKTEGRLIGISLGVDLADTDRIAVLKAGLRVPALLADQESEGSQAIIGQSVFVDDETGLATGEGEESSETRAIYASQLLTGIAEDGTEVSVALVDLVGGL